MLTVAWAASKRWPCVVRAGGQAQGLDGHDLAAVQGDQAMGRAHELHVAPAVGELVGHDLGDGQLGQGLVQGLLQALGQRGARLQAVPEQGLGFAIGQALQLGHDLGAGTQGRQLLQQRRCGLAVGREGHGNGHQLLLHGLVGGLGSNVGNMHAEAARRGKGLSHAGIASQAFQTQHCDQNAGKVFA